MSESELKLRSIKVGEVGEKPLRQVTFLDGAVSKVRKSYESGPTQEVTHELITYWEEIMTWGRPRWWWELLTSPGNAWEEWRHRTLIKIGEENGWFRDKTR